MSLEFIGSLYSENNRAGQSMLVGVGKSDRYNRISADMLRDRGLYANINSTEINTTDEADGNIVLLQNDDFSGAFAQFSDARRQGDIWWHTWGHTGSVLLIASNRKGTQETRVSFHDQFHDKWNNFLDSKLQERPARREGEPTLTWVMFPTNVSHLDHNLTYLKIYQPLHIYTPSIGPFGISLPDYAASMTYHVYLYVNGDHHVRAWGKRWAYWVESGVLSQEIAGQLKPLVSDGLSDLQDQLNQQFTLLDLLGPVSDVYYLPGRQLQPIGTAGLKGNTNDDITIVIAH